MKIQISVLAITLFSLSIFNACQKQDKNNVALDSKTSQFNTDASNYKSEADQVDNDINNSLKDIPAFGKGGNSGLLIFSSPLCGVTIDSSQIAQKILFFNFDGITPCFSPSRTRSGQIKVQLTSGTHWSDAGAVLTETFTNFKITRLSDHKSIMFNGIKTLKNINGNNWLGFVLSQATLKYQERAFNIDVKYDDGSTAVWNSARLTEWTYVQSGTNPNIPYAYITFTAKGDTALNLYSNVDTWGTNRYGYPFTTYYNAPVVSNTYCGLWRFNSGELVHNVNNQDYTLTVGVDETGNPTPYTCAYGFKVTWTANNKTHEVILSY